MLHNGFLFQLDIPRLFQQLCFWRFLLEALPEAIGVGAFLSNDGATFSFSTFFGASRLGTTFLSAGLRVARTAARLAR